MRYFLLILALLWPSLSFAQAIQNVTLFPNQLYSTGTYVATATPQTIRTSFNFHFDRTAWANATVKSKLVALISLDAGVTWAVFCGWPPSGPPWTIPGDVFVICRDNNKIANRRISVTMTITGGALTTTGVLTMK